MGQFGHVDQLQSCHDTAFREFYEIYAASIAHREQKPEPWICKMLTKPGYRFLVLKAGGHVKGFSILFLPPEDNFALLEYMAVAESARNHGMGSALFKQTMPWAKAPDGRAIPVLLEVDAERNAGEEQELRHRRQQFYRRLGCLRLEGLHYILPLSGKGPVPEMDLMLYDKTPPSQVPKADVERWLKTVYRDVYHCKPDDPRITRMLKTVGNAVPLE